MTTMDQVLARIGPPPKGKTMLEWMAEWESAAAKRSWGGGSKCPQYTQSEKTRQRRQDWADLIAPISPATRGEAATAWDCDLPTADGRLQSLANGGFAERIPGRPIRWAIKGAVG